MDPRAYFFIGTDDVAALATPYPPPAGVPFTDECDSWDAVAEWEDRFSGNDPRGDQRTGDPRLVNTIVNDGFFVFAVSDRLRRQLREASDAELRAVGDAWSESRRAEGEAIDAPEAYRFLTVLRSLAITAEERGEQLYCSGL